MQLKTPWKKEQWETMVFKSYGFIYTFLSVLIINDKWKLHKHYPKLRLFWLM